MTCSIGVCGQNAVAEIENKRPRAQSSQDLRERDGRDGSPPATEQQRIEIALHRNERSAGYRLIQRSGMLVSQPMASMPVSLGIAFGKQHRSRAESR